MVAHREFINQQQQQQDAPQNGHGQNYFSRHHTNNKLPSAVELASRLEEARTSAKLLEQVVMNTPPTEILDNDLIREFADRCLSASRSIQGYMVASNPGPDNETMESLIDTNEQLQTALNQHQRSVLSARKQLGLNLRSETATPTAETPAPAEYEVSPIVDTPVLPVRNGKGKMMDSYAMEASGSGSGSALASASGSGLNKGKKLHGGDDDEDPFADPFSDPQHGENTPNGAGSRSRTPALREEMPLEPFHPGFTPASNAPPVQPTGSAAATVSPLTKNSSVEDLYESAAKGKSSY